MASGQRSIRSFFSPIAKSVTPPAASTAAGDQQQQAASPDENIDSFQTPVSSQKRRGSAARIGIHQFDESPVSSRRKERRSSQPIAGHEQPVRKKARKVVDISEDSDDDWLPDCESPVGPVNASGVTQTPTSTSAVSRTMSTPLITPQSRPPLLPSTAPYTPTSAKSPALSSLPPVGSEDEPGDSSSEWPPKDPKYRFLWPQFIRDAAGRRPDDPDYDATTLKVPDSFLREQTGAQAQWWQMKSQHMDTVLFFKVGKFYELFHMDSLIGVDELSLLPMAGSRLHTGFPEKSIQKYTDILRERGYRVARVEQTESNSARDQRVRTGTREKNVVNREICQITTPGTSRDLSVEGDTASKYLLSLCQHVLSNDQAEETSEKWIFGICFTDTTVGRFVIGQFGDDRSCSRLRSLLAHYPPAEILIEKHGLNQEAMAVIRMWLPSAIVRPLVRGKQFYSETQTLKLIQDRRYFESGGGYPEVLMQMLDPSDGLLQTACPEYSMSIKSLGGMLFYLNQCLIDEELLTMKLFEKYVPPDLDPNADAAAAGTAIDEQTVRLPASLILDSLTLNHMDIFESELGAIGTLFSLLNYTDTQFGQRLLRHWVSSPLTSIAAINARLDAVSDLSEPPLLTDQKELFSFLKEMPDAERLLNFIHTQGLLRKNDHPDSRAQLFEDYDKKKIHSLSHLVTAFFTAVSAIKMLQLRIPSLKSTLLKLLLTFESAGGQFPDIEARLTQFVSNHDLNEAKTTGKVKPASGPGSEYARLQMDMADIKRKLNDILADEQKVFGSKLKFSSASGKKKYLLEVPSDVYQRVNPGSRYKYEGSKRNATTFYVPEIISLLPVIEQCEERDEAMVADAQRRMFADFAADFLLWDRAIKCMATIDALLSLSRARSSLQAQFINMSRPELLPVTSDSAAVLDIRAGKHPVLAKRNPHFVPNDLSLNDKLVIVTGPNMGGKSTLMRQTGLIVIMAQIGSFVPAASVRMTPVDRIFTRLGAMDRIAEGESTFFVELSETSTIIRHATRHSLVLLDELGRGTSTHDGTAIAYAVVSKLSHDKRCRTLFSTHYHNLVQEFAGSEYVTSCHMDCQVTSDDAVSGQQEVTFLYRVAEGSCPKSYGFNVARMAGLPDPVVREARLAAIRLEQKAMRRKELHRLIHQLTVSPIPVAAEQTELARSLCRRIKDLSLQLEQ